MTDSYNPFPSGRSLPGTFRGIGTGTPDNPANADEEDAPPAPAKQPPPFVPPPYPDAVKVDLATVSPEDRNRLAANFDSAVATKWADYQHNVLGVAPEQRTALPPDYTPARQVVAQSQKSLPLIPPTLKPDNPTPDDITARGTREPTGMTFGKEANQALDQAGAPAAPAPKPAPAGGGGTPAGPDYTGRLGADFDERIRAMEDEAAARGDAATSISGAYEGAAETQRQAGKAGMAEAHARAEAVRAKIAEVDQLNRDYANEHIDPDKFWHDKTAVQKVATVLGAMFAGLGGGVKGAGDYVNGMVDRSIALQQNEIEQHYKAGLVAQNLLSSFMRTSENEGEAVEKARAALTGAAMTEVARASAAAKGPIEQAQIRQLIADMKSTRDMALAKLAAQRQAGAAQSARGLEVNPQSIIGLKGETYLIPDKTWADDAKNTLSAYDRLEDGIKTGLQILDARSGTDYANPWSANIRQGEGIDATIQESLAKLSSARGVPTNIQQIAREALPQFGSRTGSIDRPKAEQMLKMIDHWRSSTLDAAQAIPVEVQTGPGVGKKANEFTYYATPRQPRPRAQPQAPAQKDYGFQASR